MTDTLFTYRPSKEKLRPFERRFSKRETTVRKWTFVKEPAGLVHQDIKPKSGYTSEPYKDASRPSKIPVPKGLNLLLESPEGSESGSDIYYDLEFPSKSSTGVQSTNQGTKETSKKISSEVERYYSGHDINDKVSRKVETLNSTNCLTETDSTETLRRSPRKVFKTNSTDEALNSNNSATSVRILNSMTTGTPRRLPNNKTTCTSSRVPNTKTTDTTGRVPKTVKTGTPGRVPSAATIGTPSKVSNTVTTGTPRRVRNNTPFGTPRRVPNTPTIGTPRLVGTPVESKTPRNVHKIAETDAPRVVYDLETKETLGKVPSPVTKITPAGGSNVVTIPGRKHNQDSCRRSLRLQVGKGSISNDKQSSNVNELSKELSSLDDNANKNHSLLKSTREIRKGVKRKLETQTSQKETQNDDLDSSKITGKQINSVLSKEYSKLSHGGRGKESSKLSYGGMVSNTSKKYNKSQRQNVSITEADENDASQYRKENHIDERIPHTTAVINKDMENQSQVIETQQTLHVIITAKPLDISQSKMWKSGSNEQSTSVETGADTQSDEDLVEEKSVCSPLDSEANESKNDIFDMTTTSDENKEISNDRMCSGENIIKNSDPVVLTNKNQKLSDEKIERVAMETEQDIQSNDFHDEDSSRNSLTDVNTIIKSLDTHNQCSPPRREEDLTQENEAVPDEEACNDEPGEKEYDTEPMEQECDAVPDEEDCNDEPGDEEYDTQPNEEECNDEPNEVHNEKAITSVGSKTKDSQIQKTFMPESILVSSTSPLRKKTSKKVKKKVRIEPDQNHLSRHEDQSFHDQTINMWNGQHRNRSKRDVIDLDIILDSVTNILRHESASCESSLGKKALNSLLVYTKKDLTGLIDKIDELKGDKRDIHTTRKDVKILREKLIGLQKEKISLMKEIKTKKDKGKSKLKVVNKWLLNMMKMMKSNKIKSPKKVEYVTYGFFPSDVQL